MAAAQHINRGCLLTRPIQVRGEARLPDRLGRGLRRLVATSWELGLVVVLAAAVRLAFLSNDPPPLLTTDSLTYAQPAIHLVHGEGFDLSLRRTPAYPIFLAGLWAAFGDDLRPVVYAQHLIGVGTALLTLLLGRVAFGRVAGLIGGLAVALSGPQIIFEHYLMTESFFTLMLTLGTLALVLALKRRQARLFLLTGIVFGLCALTRPIGQILPAFVPFGVMVSDRRGRDVRDAIQQAIWAGLLALIGFGLVTAPWIARNRLVGGELTSSSALGKTLFGRITRHDDGFRFDLPPAGPAETDPYRAEARAVARQAAQDDTSRGSLIHQRLVREFGLSEAQAYNVMRDVALEVLLAQPAYYFQSSLTGAIELFFGQDESLRGNLERLAVPRLRRDWQQASELSPMLPPPVPPEVRWQTLNRSIWASRIYQPSGELVARLLGLLFLAGCVAIVSRPAWRSALSLPLIVVLVTLLSSFLDGPVPRFRYPLDPLIALTAAAGLLTIVELAREAARRRLGGRLVAGVAGPIQPERAELK